jgi:uncharacterized membrane protein YraQ (UPF0718 family)
MVGPAAWLLGFDAGVLGFDAGLLGPEAWSALHDSWNFFVHLAVVLVPLFLGASFLVGLAQEYLPPEAVEQKLRGHDEGTGNVAAAGLGAVTPFCSCSTVPVLAGLLQAGAPLGLAFSFLLASPLVNEIAVILLLGLFGLEVTVWYVVTTFTAAVVGGIVIGRLGMNDHVRDVRIADDGNRAVASDGGTVGGGNDGGTVGDRCDGGTAECGCDGGEISEKTHGQRVETAAREALSFFVETLPYLVLGITIGALIHGVVPVEMVHAVLGRQNPLAVPLAAIAGAPIYVSLSGMLPIAASLSEQGIAIGTVLAFVIGGAGVSLPNLILLNKLFERRLLAVYAGTVVAIGILVGVVFNFFLV